jgi:hypothetical protein
MTRNKFFDVDGLNLYKQDVYFEGTREEKLKRIEHLGCTHFIDDLEEVFQEQDFPDGVQKILYAPSASDSRPSGMTVATTWAEIGRLIFGADGEHAD